MELPLRTRAAALAGRVVSEVSRRAGRGAGSVIGGRVTLAIDPSALEQMAAGHKVALVSGTNGKTTTTRLLAAALSTRGPVETNAAGSNLLPGLVGALSYERPGAVVALEVDEGLLAEAAAAVEPDVVVLLNLSRDQLDRIGEVRLHALAWRRMLDTQPGATVVANVDDPLVVWAAGSAAAKVWVGTGQRWREDAATCPACGNRIRWEPASGGTQPGDPKTGDPKTGDPRTGDPTTGDPRTGDPTTGDPRTGDPRTGDPRTGDPRTGDPRTGDPKTGDMAPEWACSSCSLRRPKPDLWLEGRDLVLLDGQRLPVNLQLPGWCNLANAAMAAGAVVALGQDPAWAVQAMARVGTVAGRYSQMTVDGVRVRLLLAKNPAGWAEALDLIRPAPLPVVIGINARVADGHDPSWLWDVPFERLRGRHVVATGERGRDLAVRLRYADVSHTYVDDYAEAVRAAGGPEVDLAANYTSFQDARVALAIARG